MCCSICLEEFVEQDNLIITSCKHTFHKQCLEKVTLPHCPLCRTNIVDDLEKPVESTRSLRQRIDEFTTNSLRQRVVYWNNSDDSDEEDTLIRSSSPKGFFHRMGVKLLKKQNSL